MIEYLGYPALLLSSLIVILFACELFTNGIEWTGKRLDLSAGATGSVLAAVGTALPETSIPILALIAGGGSVDIAVGAIAGAPFMLSTLAFFVSGAAFFIFKRRGIRPSELAPDISVIRRDLGFFIVIYSVAVLTTFVESHNFRVAVALGLTMSYAYYIFLTLGHEGEKAGELEELHLSKLLRAGTHTGHIALQVLFSLSLLATGAHFFIIAVQHVSVMLNIPTMLLALIITPVATELPEKMNSVLWIKEGKDTLALGNITGAMVFQSSFPVAIGVAFTPWHLHGPTMVSAFLAIASASVCFFAIKRKNALPPGLLAAGGLFYLVFIVYLLV